MNPRDLRRLWGGQQIVWRALYRGGSFRGAFLGHRGSLQGPAFFRPQYFKGAGSVPDTAGEETPMPTKPAPRLLTRKQAAERLGLSVATLQAWVFRNKGPSFIRTGPERGKVLYAVDELDRWSSEHTIRPSKRRGGADSAPPQAVSPGSSQAAGG